MTRRDGKHCTTAQRWQVAARLVEDDLLPAAALTKRSICPQQFRAALRTWQRSRGIRASGTLNQETYLAIVGLHFCHVPEPLGGYDHCRWPKDAAVDLTWSFEGVLNGLSRDDTLAQIADGHSRWPPVAGVRFRYVTNAKTSRLRIITARLDGPLGTLADCQLPCNARSNSQMQMRIDTSEDWRRLPLPVVVAHEGGHGIGIGHGRDLMAPSLGSDTHPGAWSIAEARKRYGGPLPAPTPDPTPDPGPGPGGPRVVKVRIASLDPSVVLQAV